MTRTASKLLAIALAGVVAAATFALYTMEASARGQQSDDGDRTSVRIDNAARVSNSVLVGANSGANSAEGGTSGRGAGGGNAVSGGLVSIISSNDGGGGGNSGRGGDGGTIATGPARAIGTVQSDVNSTEVMIESCGCDDHPDVTMHGHHSGFMSRGAFLLRISDNERLHVNVQNRSGVDNNVAVLANSGLNNADGGNSGRGGEGGNAAGPWRSWLAFHAINDGGEGGDSGAAGRGGTVRTDTAYADGLVTTLANRTSVEVTSAGEEEEESSVDPD